MKRLDQPVRCRQQHLVERSRYAAENSVHLCNPKPMPNRGAFVKEFIMNEVEQKRYNALYRKHLRALKLQGISD
jgi:hypothetical protein